MHKKKCKKMKYKLHFCLFPSNKEGSPIGLPVLSFLLMKREGGAVHTPPPTVAVKVDLYVDTRAHHVIVERRPTVFSHEDGLDEETDLIDVMPEKLGDFQLAVAVSRNNDCHVDVAVRIGIALAVGTVHHDLRFNGKAGADNLLVSANETKGLVAG